MTTLAMRGYSLALKTTLTTIFSSAFSWFFSLGKAIQVSRQMSTNEHIAQQLLHEYPEHTYYSLLAELNHKTMEGYVKNVKVN